MSNIRTLRAAFPGAQWKVAFVSALMRLRPDLNPDAIDEISDSQFAVAQTMHPDVAASQWAGAHIPDDAGETRSA